MNIENEMESKKKNKASIHKKITPIITQLDIELTERCNYDCIHCYINLPARELKVKKKELSTEKIKDIIFEAVMLGCKILRFTGGEPLLHDDFEDIYIFSRKLGLRVLLFTNASLITKGKAELFSRILPLEKIEISVYGMKKESYEAVTRTSGSYKAAFHGISLLKRNKIPFVVKGAILPPNKNEINEFENWATSLPGINKPPSFSMFFDLRSRHDSKEKNETIKKLRLSPEEGLNILAKNKEKYITDLKNFCSKFLSLRGSKIFSCGSGIGTGSVDAYGYLQPCLLLRAKSCIYNLKKGTLKDAFTNFFPKIRKIIATDPDYKNRCAKCFLQGLCEQCPAKSWTEHGVLDKPVEYLCDIAHIQAKYLGLIKRDEKAWEVKNWKERIQKLPLSSSESIWKQDMEIIL